MFSQQSRLCSAKIVSAAELKSVVDPDVYRESNREANAKTRS